MKHVSCNRCCSVTRCINSNTGTPVNLRHVFAFLAAVTLVGAVVASDPSLRSISSKAVRLPHRGFYGALVISAESQTRLLAPMSTHPEPRRRNLLEIDGEPLFRGNLGPELYYQGIEREIKVEELRYPSRPNKSLQPTATAVTPPAAQEIVPAVAVAEH
jgi:hypothetical protein